jgi:agmatine/peptidylarginine deiminase
MPRLIAEWMPQSAVLLVWPHRDTDWAANLAAATATYAHLGAEITRRQLLLLVCPDETQARAARTELAQAGADLSRLRTLIAGYDDTWARDFGPLSVGGDSNTLMDFRFNGWGERFAAAADDRLSRRLAELGVFAVPLRRRDEVLEGGSIDTDGQGSLLTTRRCLMHPMRNPGLGEADIEQLLASELGCQRVLWLDAGWLAGDDTDGHVDNLARFTEPDTIVHAVCENPSDPHFEPLQRMAGELNALRRADGRTYRLVPLPLPGPVMGLAGHRLPASYVNFLIINTAVLVPTFDDPADTIALDRLAGCFTGREIVAIDARPLLEQGGGIHCISMQLAKGVVRP